MYSKPILFLASLLYQYCFSIYNKFYFFYKSKKDVDEIKLFKRYIKKGSQVVDIGANIGFHTVLFSKLVGKTGHVYAFEPENNNFLHLKQNTKNYKNVSIYKKAISYSSTPVILYTSNLINVDHKTYKTPSYKKSYKVSTTLIDKFLRDVKIDFIKIDIQGAEYNALKGMKKTLQNNKKVMIFIECWPEGLRKNNTDPRKLESFFQKFSLKVFILDNGRPRKITQKDFTRYSSYKNYDFDNWLVFNPEKNPARDNLK